MNSYKKDDEKRNYDSKRLDILLFFAMIRPWALLCHHLYLSQHAYLLWFRAWCLASWLPQSEFNLGASPSPSGT